MQVQQTFSRTHIFAFWGYPRPHRINPFKVFDTRGRGPATRSRTYRPHPASSPVIGTVVHISSSPIFPLFFTHLLFSVCTVGCTLLCSLSLLWFWCLRLRCWSRLPSRVGPSLLFISHLRSASASSSPHYLYSLSLVVLSAGSALSFLSGCLVYRKGRLYMLRRELVVFSCVLARMWACVRERQRSVVIVSV